MIFLNFIYDSSLERWYTDKHEWITVDGKTGIVGISDYAQDALGDVVYAQLPDVGSMVKKGGKILSHLTITFLGKISINYIII